MRRLRHVFVTMVCLLAAGPLAVAQENTAGQEAPPQVLFVSSIIGENINTGGSPGAPLHDVQAAVNRCGPGSRIVLMAGWYDGGIVLKPGTPERPITLCAEIPGRAVIFARDRTHAAPVGITLADFTVVDGLTLLNFSEAAIRGEQVQHVAIQDCRLFHNGYGVYLAESRDCIVRNNEAWENHPAGSPAAQIAFAGPTTGVRAEGNSVHNAASGINGILFNAGSQRNNVLRRNLLWETGAAAIQPPGENNVAEFNVCIGPLGATLMRYNTFLVPAQAISDPKTDLLVPQFKADPKFADVAWHDYRLQSDSPARGKGKGGTDLGAFQYRGDVVYVKPDGNDAAEGTCIASAWKTLRHAGKALRAGQTLYILPGEYAEPLRLVDLTGQTETHVRVYGKGRASVEQVQVVACGLIEVANLTVRGAAGTAFDLYQTEGATLRNCAAYLNEGSGVATLRCAHITLDHCALWQNGGSGLLAARTTGIEMRACIAAANKEAQVRLAEEAGEYFGDFNALAGDVIGRMPGAAAPSLDLTDWQRRSRSDSHSILLEEPLADPAHGNFRVPPGGILAGSTLFGTTPGPQ